jgi:hypothetical protein
MSGDVKTQDLGNGYYLHTYSVDTYYLTETITSPLALPPQEQENVSQLFGGQDLGLYEPYALTQYVHARDFMLEKGQLVELAHVENDKLVINPQAIEVFKHYPEFEISFVGNYGRVNSGKSFWYDKILNLTHFDGHGVCHLLYSTKPTRAVRASTSGASPSVKGNSSSSCSTTSASRVRRNCPEKMNSYSIWNCCLLRSLWSCPSQKMTN